MGFATAGAFLDRFGLPGSILTRGRGLESKEQYSSGRSAAKRFTGFLPWPVSPRVLP
jgi:hypothetical protein